jgi:hypothetical protein
MSTDANRGLNTCWGYCFWEIKEKKDGKGQMGGL